MVLGKWGLHVSASELNELITKYYLQSASEKNILPKEIMSSNCKHMAQFFVCFSVCDLILSWIYEY